MKGIARTQSPLPKIAHPRYPHLGYSQGSAPPECNGEPRPGKTAFVITVSPVPGKYEENGDPRAQNHQD